MTRRTAALLALATAGGAAVPVVAGAGGSDRGPADRAACRVPATLEGVPRAYRARMAGAHLWHDAGGWHVRLVARDAQQRLTVIARAASVARPRLRDAEGSDGARRSNGSRRLTVALAARPGDVDGVDFGARCGALRFHIVSSGPVRTGRSGTAPAAAFAVPARPRTGVRGRVVLGGSCGPDGSGFRCEERPYATTVDVSRGGKRGGAPPTPVTSFDTDADGRFDVTLEPGDHVLTPRPKDGSARARPLPVRVDAGLLTEAVVALGTGMRGPGPRAPSGTRQPSG